MKSSITDSRLQLFADISRICVDESFGISIAAGTERKLWWLFSSFSHTLNDVCSESKIRVYTNSFAMCWHFDFVALFILNDFSRKWLFRIVNLEWKASFMGIRWLNRFLHAFFFLIFDQTCVLLASVDDIPSSLSAPNKSNRTGNALQRLTILTLTLAACEAESEIVIEGFLNF